MNVIEENMMGGNALKNCETRRVTANEYHTLSNEVMSILSKYFPMRRISPIVAYNNKPDFGDLDILFELHNEEEIPFTAADLASIFDSKEVVYNNGKHEVKGSEPKSLVNKVYSLEYKGFQVDIIPTLLEDYPTSYFYYAYNDLGNLMGRIAHKMGFKYGHKGLTYELRTMEDHVVATLEVSKNMLHIFEFMGYDPALYLKGFNELEDIFKFASSSIYFNKEIFALENRNHKSRIRDKKRKNYTLFLEWLEVNEPENKYPWPNMEERGGRKDVQEFMMEAFKVFPLFRIDFLIEREKAESIQAIKEIFNGDIVREMTSLEGIELGNFMKYLRNFGDTTTYKSLPLLIKTLATKDNIEHFVRYHFMMYNILNSVKKIEP